MQNPGELASRLRYGGYRRFSAAESWRASLRVPVGPFRLVAHGVSYEAENPGALPESLLVRDRDQAFPTNLRRRTGESGRQGQLGVLWTGKAGPAELDVMGYGVNRSLDNRIPTTYIVLGRVAGGGRAVARGVIGEGQGVVRWSAGAEADAQHDDRKNFRYLADPPWSRDSVRTLDQRERVSTGALFAQLGVSRGAVDLLGSVRHDRYRFSVRDRRVQGGEGTSGSRRFAEWSPAVGMTVALGGGVHVYANFATAFETPTTTELANRPDSAGGFNPSLEPQRTRSFEAGVKGRAARRLRYEAALYEARVRGALVPFEVATAPGRIFFRNAGLVRHRGVEASVVVTPRRGVELHAGYTRIDARFVRYAVGVDTFDANRLPGVAPERWTARLRLERAPRSFLEIDARRVSATPTTDANVPGTSSPAYSVLDARAGCRWTSTVRWDALLFAGATNLLAARYNTSVVPNAFGGRYYEPGPGRALYVGVELGRRRIRHGRAVHPLPTSYSLLPLSETPRDL